MNELKIDAAPTGIAGTEEFRKRQAEIIALTIGGNFDFQVKFGPKGSGSHWDPIHREYVFDSQILEYSENEALGVISHEADHENVSDLEPVMDLWPQLGFSFGFNAVEDPRANQGGMKLNPGTRPWKQAYIERDLGPGGGLDYKGIKKDTRQALGYVPKFMQAGAEIIRYWYEREFAGKIADPKTSPQQFIQDMERFLQEIPDKDVKEYLKYAQSYFDTYYVTTPDSRDKAEKKRKAQISSDNFRENMWPVYQKLVERSFKDQSMVDMVKDMLKQKTEQQAQGAGGPAIEIPYDALPQDIKDEIEQKMKEHAEQQAEERQQEKEAESKPSEGGEEQKEGEETTENQVPWDQLSDRAKEEIEKVYDGKNDKGEKLTDEQRKKHQQKAQQDLEEVEDAANEKLRGDMVDKRQTETHKEKEEREAQEKQDQRKKATEKIVQEMEKKAQEAKEELKANPYHEFMVATDVDIMIKRWKPVFQRLFEPSIDPEKRFSSTGLKLSLKGAFKRAADQRFDKVWEAKGVPRLKDFRYSILVDLSGSMRDYGKIDETFKMIVAFSELMNAFGIEFEIIGFTDSLPNDVRLYKGFEEKKLTREVRDRIGELYYDCVSAGGGTPTREATLIAYQSLRDRIRRRPMQNNYFITLTDGQCTSCSAEEMVRTISSIVRQRLAVTTGLGIGQGTEFVNQSYSPLPQRVKQQIARVLGKSFDEVGSSFPDISNFTQAFPIIIEYMIRQPGLFFKVKTQ